MITKEFKTTRLVLTKEEKIIAKSWGLLWARFGSMERRGKSIYILFGDWSGYRSSQYRITHIDHTTKVNESYRGTVLFSDNTTMSVWVVAVTRADIIRNKWNRRQSYNTLISKLLDSDSNYYKV